jgi:hypothetical protein
MIDVSMDLVSCCKHMPQAGHDQTGQNHFHSRSLLKTLFDNLPFDAFASGLLAVLLNKTQACVNKMNVLTIFLFALPPVLTAVRYSTLIIFLVYLTSYRKKVGLLDHFPACVTITTSNLNQSVAFYEIQ